MSACEGCGSILGEQTLFCPNCGAKAAARPSAEEQQLDEKIPLAGGAAHS